MPFEKYPSWIAVKGPGHPQNPGFVLVENEDQERTALAEGEGPADLNPPPEAGQKTLAEMNREELKTVLLREGIPDDMTDDDIRAAIEHGRERRAEYQRQDAEEANERREAREAGGDHGDGMQTDRVPPDDAAVRKDAAGDKIAPDPADEANKGGNDATRTAPGAKTAPAADSRSDEAKEKVADDKPAGNVTEAAATPPKHKRGAAAVPGKE